VADRSKLRAWSKQANDTFHLWHWFVDCPEHGRVAQYMSGRSAWLALTGHLQYVHKTKG
jgi:hypothetical protein